MANNLYTHVAPGVCEHCNKTHDGDNICEAKKSWCLEKRLNREAGILIECEYENFMIMKYVGERITPGILKEYHTHTQVRFMIDILNTVKNQHNDMGYVRESHGFHAGNFLLLENGTLIPPTIVSIDMDDFSKECHCGDALQCPVIGEELYNKWGSYITNMLEDNWFGKCKARKVLNKLVQNPGKINMGIVLKSLENDMAELVAQETSS